MKNFNDYNMYENIGKFPSDEMYEWYEEIIIESDMGDPLKNDSIMETIRDRFLGFFATEMGGLSYMDKIKIFNKLS